MGASLEVAPPQSDGRLDNRALGELRRRTAQGAVASFAFQASNLTLRTGSMVILARMLAPTDFGLVGMVTAMTGFMALFKEAGLSNATVQSATINDHQLSTLFWINVALGSGLTLLCIAAAPAVAAFYGQPQLSAITMVVGTSFLFTGLAAQHRAILLRDLRIRMLAVIDIISLVATIVLALGLAAAGFGYWALVANAVVVSVGGAIGVWLAAGWIPGRPRRSPGTRRMIAYGGTVTLNSLIVYLAYNIDKVLLGRYWGAEAVGIYGRAYQLMNLPTDSLHSTVGAVAFPALSRLQEDPVRLRHYFLTIYRFLLAVALPITVVCGFFAEDVVLVLLGPQWRATVPVFRLLAPTILVFALINPLGWLMFATAQMKRSLKIATTIMVMSVTAYSIGLGGGPSGVALGFSTAMVLLLVPVVVWARRGTLITSGDVFKSIGPPLGSVLIGAGAAMAMWPWLGTVEPALLRLTLTSGVVFGVHLAVLLFAFGERDGYSKLLAEAGFSWARR
jgi:O-antigen/teichoic acid export membrane protein